MRILTNVSGGGVLIFDTEDHVFDRGYVVVEKGGNLRFVEGPLPPEAHLKKSTER